MNEIKLKYKGKQVGKVIDDVYITSRKSRLNQKFLIHDGYAISDKIIDLLAKMSVKWVLFTGDEHLRTPLLEFQRSKVTHDDKGDIQKIVKIEEMERI